MLLYALVRWIDSGRASVRYALPLGCYYVITLGVPLVNGASYVNDAFLGHAVTVLLVPPVIVLFVWAMRRLVSFYPRRKVSAGSSPHARRAGNQAAAAATTAIAAAPNR